MCLSNIIAIIYTAVSFTAVYKPKWVKDYQGIYFNDYVNYDTSVMSRMVDDRWKIALHWALASET